MKKKHKTRSESKMGNQNARKGLDKKQTYDVLLAENEMLHEEIDAMYEVLREIRALVI